MYSGTTLHRGSGGVLGVHQKIDRVCLRHLKPNIPLNITFPAIKEILHFEGNNGPDGIKRKSPSRDEPWHFFDPNDPRDVGLIAMIEDHLHNLIIALSDDNHERSAFEAAWLAHAIVDGLTPAHHYPFEEKLQELRGQPNETRRTVRDKLIISGDNRRDTLQRNWQFWGAKGIMMNHILFEAGVATTAKPKMYAVAKPSSKEYLRIQTEGLVPIFHESAISIYTLKMYDTFEAKGWTKKLARQTNEVLMPTIIKNVTLAWYYAAYRASQRKKGIIA